MLRGTLEGGRWAASLVEVAPDQLVQQKEHEDRTDAESTRVRSREPHE